MDLFNALYTRPKPHFFKQMVMVAKCNSFAKDTFSGKMKFSEIASINYINIHINVAIGNQDLQNEKRDISTSPTRPLLKLRVLE